MSRSWAEGFSVEPVATRPNPANQDTFPTTEKYLTPAGRAGPTDTPG